MSRAARRRPIQGDWLNWLHTNVARGCSKEELAGILRKEGFDERSIQEGFESAPAHGSAAAVPEAVAALQGRIPRAHFDLPNAVRHGPAGIELYTVDDFLDAAECAEIAALIRKALRPSTISTPPSGEYDKAFRTSRTCDLPDAEPAVARLNDKIARAIGFDPALAELTQGQHYEVGQVFKTHTDFFKPYELDRYSTEVLGQRTWTFMIYLNEPEGGGETEFPDAGIKVTPKLGRAVIWNNLLRSGEGNMLTRHQSLPVTGGTKTIITKWFRMPRRKKPAFSSGRVAWTQRTAGIFGLVNK